MNSPLKLIILDSNPTDVIVLRHLLKLVSPDIEICGDAQSVTQAVTLIETHHPDIIFSDIILSDGDAFQVFEKLRQNNIPIEALVCMSNTERYDYAVKAIEYGCLAFLTKPLSESTVGHAIAKAKMVYTHRIEMETLQGQLQKKSTKLLIPTAHNGREIVESDMINYFEASGQCTVVHLINGTHITAFRILGHFKKLLANDAHFFLIHQSFLVNVNQVKSFHLPKHKVTMKNNVSLEASRRYGSNFKDYWRDYDKKNPAQENGVNMHA
jgi:two-component system, LytTR family, response regulator